LCQACETNGVPASPWLTAPKLIIKHRNEEGGLGFQVFTNATAGGDWIIQRALVNSEHLARLLPPDAPLSTLRIVSSSAASLRAAPRDGAEVSDITLLSACWRAGRAGADTDHKSVLFDVDLPTGEIRGGTTNSHWYQLGVSEAARCPWRSKGHTIRAHPDTGAQISGKYIPEMDSVRQIVLEAHARLCPGVPLVGWDVAMTTEGICLLEANLSCNFFRASFDKDGFFCFVEQAMKAVDDMAA